MATPMSTLTMGNKVYEIVDKVARAGNYITATTAAKMDNPNAIYVYTGNESGYNQGHLYYWDGTAFVDGGEYNAPNVELDPTLTDNNKAAPAGVVGTKISEIKEDLSPLPDLIADVPIDITPTWTNGSVINISNGTNATVTWACRTNYIVLSQPTVIRFNLDFSRYNYNLWAYTASSVSTAVRNLTGSERIENERFIYIPKGNEVCIRICVALKSKTGTLTDDELTTISEGISFYRITDTTLTKSNVPADAKATGDAIQAVYDEIQSGDIIPIKPAGTTTTNSVTLVSDGSGSYTISGTASSNTVHNIYYSESALPDGFEVGKSYKVKVNIPSLYTHLRIAYYDGTNWALLMDERYDTEFTIPAGTVGFYIRFFCYSGGLNSPEFTVHPQIFRANTIGAVEGELTPSRYPMMMTIIDDDGYGSFYTDILPLCISKCAPIASAIITQRITASTEGSGNGYMTWTQVQECARNGAEILSHGYNHKTDAQVLEDGTTAEQLEMWYRGARNDLEIHGIRSDIFVFNNNTANVIQCQQAARRVYKAAFHAAGYEINHEGTTDPFYIKRFNFTASTLETAHTIEEMKENIDTLATAGTGWLVWMIHTSSTNGWSSDEVTKLGQAIDYARSLGIEIVTAERGCRTYLPYQGI